MSNTSYNVEIEFEKRDVTDDEIDELLDVYKGMSPAVIGSPRGWVGVIVSVEAPSLPQAVVFATALATYPLHSVEVMTSKEFDRRGEAFRSAPLPELLSIPEVAERLGTSRQAVHLRIKSGSLPATRVGRSWVVPATAI